MTKLHTISIVIPFYNESESIQELVTKLEHLNPKEGIITEYIFVDDGSTDDGFDILKKLRGKIKRSMTLVRFRKNNGKSAALAVGFTYAKGEYLMTLDADLQDEPDEIDNLIQGLNQGSDIVIGWRKNRQDPVSKKISSKIFNSTVAKLYGVKLHDMNSGLKVFTKEVALEIRLYGELHRFFPVLAAVHGFKVSEVPVTHHNRQYGKSKYSTKRIMHAFFDLTSTLFLTSFEYQPMQIFGSTGIVSILTGTVILIYLSVLHFMGQSIIRRPLLLLGMLFVLFGVQIMSTGLIGELIIHKQREAPTYPIAEILE
jgi:glycosyltransferase involved in cell wall biosynthesis